MKLNKKTGGKFFRPQIFKIKTELFTRLAALRAEFSFVDRAAFAFPFVADWFRLAALGAEFSFVDRAAFWTFPFVDDGLRCSAFRAEVAAIFFVSAS